MGQKNINGDLNVTGSIKHNGTEISYSAPVTDVTVDDVSVLDGTIAKLTTLMGPTGPTGAVLYNQAQQLTEAQKAIARNNIGVEQAGTEIYIVDYDHPNYDDAKAAFDDGQVVLLKGAAPDANSYALINYVSDNYITFSKFLTSRHSTYAAFNTYYLTPQNTWNTGDSPAGGRNVFIKTVEPNKVLSGGESVLNALEVGGVNYRLPQSLCRTGTRTLDKDNWTNQHEYTLNIPSLTVHDYVHIIGVSSADEALLAQYNIGYYFVNGAIIFRADDNPLDDIELQIAVISGTEL